METVLTGVDKLVHIVKESGRISVDDAAKALSLPKEIVEDWADLLEQGEIIGKEYGLSNIYLFFKMRTDHEVTELTKALDDRKESFVRRAGIAVHNLDPYTADLSKLKEEFDIFNKQLASNVSGIQKHLGLLSRYERMKREVDGKLKLQKEKLEAKRETFEKHVLEKQQRVSMLLNKITLTEQRLEKDSMRAELFRKEQFELQAKLKGVMQKAREVEAKVKSNLAVSFSTAGQILKLKNESKATRLEIKRQGEAIMPLFHESRKYEVEINKLHNDFRQKLSLFKIKNGVLDRAEILKIKSRFNTLFSNKNAAEKLAIKLNSDLKNIKTELNELATQAAIVRITNKSAESVESYVGKFEAKMESVNSKKEKFQEAVRKVADMLSQISSE